MSDININIYRQGDKTETLTCNYCKLPHPVEPEYKASFLARAAEKIKEAEKHAGKELGIEPHEAWTCGACTLVLNGIPADAFRTECSHPVPDPED